VNPASDCNRPPGWYRRDGARERGSRDQPGGRLFDIAIIGAGVVGCAAFRGLTMAGARCVLIERDADILAGASKANSAILHTAFDASPGSLEMRCMQGGYAEYLGIRERLALPLLETSAIVVAWSADELAKLPAIVARAHANGVADVRQLAADEVRAREPRLAGDLLGGVLVPGEAVIDPWSAPLAYVLQGLANGGELRRRCEVTGGAFENGCWALATTGGRIEARVVVNCAGNYGDLVEAIARPSPFTITPRKGQFVVFDKPAYDLVQAIILPVPTERTKGVVVTRTAFGNLLVGPTAEDQKERRLATTDQARLAELIAKGERMIPALAGQTVTAAFAGLRPASQFTDYQIEALPGLNWISVGGIRSTGLTASLGIAAHLRALYESHFGSLVDLAEPVWTPVANLAEDRLRPYARAGRGEIVCHCELVTEAEIAAALAGPLPATSLGGLKRRTRCMMGRCQGFYCSWRVMQIAAGKLVDLPRAEGG
jgi:glycerol-3-phosphate dehydrogenase